MSQRVPPTDLKLTHSHPREKKSGVIIWGIILSANEKPLVPQIPMGIFC